ncbi:c2 domain-containing protein [Ditylenchus destructor]|nr:c2 domain-containing protein [Ditylenchus destructor]
MAEMHPSSSTASSSHADPLPSKSRIAELRSQILVGELPDDFLRICRPQSQQQVVSEAEGGQGGAPSQSQHHYPAEATIADFNQEHHAQAGHIPQYLSPAEHFYAFVPPHTRGRIAVKVVEAKLTKNYGIVRMDPYVRVRVGNTLFETPTSVNGGKAPSWNRTVNAYLPNEVDSIYIQIYDERAFTNDECIAWAHIQLPEGIFSNEVIDEWYSLSGPQGEGKEGVINLVISFGQVSNMPQVRATGQPDLADQQQSLPPEMVTPGPLFTEEELEELHAMFPTIDKEVIRSVLEARRGEKDSTVTALLEMAS